MDQTYKNKQNKLPYEKEEVATLDVNNYQNLQRPKNESQFTRRSMILMDSPNNQAFILASSDEPISAI